ncbi:MAG: hypothetical protein JWM99_2580 [Verrucomicrobiales bacterium]|nr:hypothetical protein [Verrucomicrobiales bacterium]
MRSTVWKIEWVDYVRANGPGGPFATSFRKVARRPLGGALERYENEWISWCVERIQGFSYSRGDGRNHGGDLNRPNALEGLARLNGLITFERMAPAVQSLTWSRAQGSGEQRTI